MAIEYCHDHHLHYDLDWWTDCPRCESEITTYDVPATLEIELAINGTIIGYYPDLDVTLRVNGDGPTLDGVIVPGFGDAGRAGDFAEVSRSDRDPIARAIWTAAFEKLRHCPRVRFKLQERGCVI